MPYNPNNFSSPQFKRANAPDRGPTKSSAPKLQPLPNSIFQTSGSSTNTGQYSRPISSPASTPTYGPGPVQTIAPPTPPSINAYLGGDTVYQQQLAQINKALADFLANQKTTKSNLARDYATAQKAVKDQSVIDLGNIEQDFAGRGLLKSGLYQGAVDKYNTDMADRLANLGTANQRSLTDLTNQFNTFQSQSTTSKENARIEALRRRANKYGLGG